MKRSNLSIFIILFLFCNSCATKTLWKATDPNDYIKIKYTKITEQELRTSGSKYHKNDITKYYYVEKNSFDKLKDYTFRGFATPVAIVVDATTFIIIGSGLVIASGMSETNKDYPESAWGSIENQYGPAEKEKYNNLPFSPNF